MIRLILCGISLLIFAIVMIPVCIVCLLLRKWQYKTAHKCVQFCMHIEMNILLFLAGCSVNVEGLENIPDEPCLFVSNHRGVFDIVVAYATNRHMLAFVGKKEARKIPLVGILMYLMGGLFLDRNDIRQGLETIGRAIDYIKDGLSIWICPEGTRQKKGKIRELLTFHAGSFRIATKTGAPVVPVLITGTREVFEDHKPFVKASKINIVYDKPVYTDELGEEDSKHIGEYFRNRIIEISDRMNIKDK